MGDIAKERADVAAKLHAAVEPNRKYVMTDEELDAACASGEFIDIQLLSTHESCGTSDPAFEAELSELLTTLELDVWQFIAPEDVRLLRGQIIPCIMLTAEKLDGNGQFIKWKARLVARGDKQYLGEWARLMLMRGRRSSSPQEIVVFLSCFYVTLLCCSLYTPVTDAHYVPPE
jgi:hypothetical protein